MLRENQRQNRRSNSTRVIADWTPKGVRSALNLLQMGRFDRAAYLWDAIVGDDRGGAVTNTRIYGLLGSPLEIQPIDESARAKQIAEALEADYWDMFPEHQIGMLLRYGLGLGVALAELRWKRSRGRLIPEIYVWHPSHLRYDEFDDRWYVLTRDGEELITPGAGKWLVYQPYGPQFAGVPSLVRGMAIAWLVKTYGIQDAARHSEKLAGLIKAKTPQAAKEDEVAGFMQSLVDLGRDGVVETPEGWDAEIMEAAAASYEGFNSLIARSETSMAIAALGQNLSTEVKGGSLAAAKAHEDVRQDYRDSDSQSLSTTIRDGILTHWTALNFGPDIEPPWAIYQVQPESDQNQEADTLDKLATGLQKLASLNVGVDTRTMLEEAGVPLLDMPEVVAAPPPAPDDETPDEEADDQVDDQPDDQTQTSRISLASGDPLPDAPGFVRGQVWTDSLTDTSAQRGAETFQPFVRRMLAEVMASSGYDDLRYRLSVLYKGSRPDEFAQIMENATMLASMAGRLAVREDAGLGDDSGGGDSVER